MSARIENLASTRMVAWLRHVATRVAGARWWARAVELSMFAAVGALAITVALPQVSPVSQILPTPLAIGGLSAVCAWLAYSDWRTKRIPNWVVYALMTAAIIRALILRDPVFLLAWGVIWIAWIARGFGGGDAKLLMGLFGLFPNERMLMVFVIGVLATGIPQVIWKYRGRWLASARRAGWRLMSRQFLPSAEELETRGQPGTWRYALVGVVYLFFFA